MINLSKEIYAHRKAIFTLVTVNIKTTVATARFGWLWWIADPLILMAIYYFIIHIVFQRGGENYHLFVLCGVVSWQFMSRSINASAKVIGQNRSLIRQIGMPISTLVAIPPLVQMFFAAIGLVIIMAWNYQVIGNHSLTVLLLLLLVALFAFGLGLILSVAEAFFKDTTKLVSYALRAGFFFSPVLYHESRILDSNQIPEIAKSLFQLNPMAWIIPSFRKVLLDGVLFEWSDYMILLASSILIVQVGLVCLRINSNKIVKML